MTFEFRCSIGTTTISYSCEEVFAQELMHHFLHFMQASGFSTRSACSAMQGVIEEYQDIH